MRTHTLLSCFKDKKPPSEALPGNFFASLGLRLRALLLPELAQGDAGTSCPLRLRPWSSRLLLQDLGYSGPNAEGETN